MSSVDDRDKFISDFRKRYAALISQHEASDYDKRLYMGWLITNGLNTPVSQLWIYQQFLNEQQMKVETTKEKVLEAAKQSPDAKKLMMELYPEVFRDDTILCEIGSIFFRKQYPKNIYAIVRQGNTVIVMNISHSAKWDEKHRININDLKDRGQNTITVDEFRRLTGYYNLSEFMIVTKTCNQNLFNYVKSFSQQM